MIVLDFPSTKFSREIAEKHGYDEFIIRRWERIFGKEMTERLIAGMEKVPRYIRINTLKADEDEVLGRLEKRGFVIVKTEVDYCYEVKEEPYSIGATPEYLMGYYYVMDKSSCIPPLALEPEPTDLVVDFASSPGGKTTMIAQLMRNKGKIIAIEGKRERIQALIDNLHRMGVLNCMTIHMNSAEFWKTRIKADKILLDAPCTGEGIIHKDPSRKISKSSEDIKFCSALQTAMLESAIKTLKVGGCLVYSTCSLTPEENEFVINRVLEKFEVHLEKISYGEPALTEVAGIKLNSEIKKARRLYPHIHRCSGFFIAKIIKDGNRVQETSSSK